MQTLIVMAVLALLVVAAGVVVIAITRNSSDNLVESANNDLKAKCQPWEVFNPAWAAAGAGGGENVSVVADISSNNPYPNGEPVVSAGAGGVTSSAIGCLAPCYLTLNDAQDLTLDLALKENRSHLPRTDELPTLSDAELARVRGPEPGDLKFDTTNRSPKYTPRNGAEPAKLEVRIGVLTEVRHTTQAGLLAPLYRFDAFLYQVDSGNINARAWEWLAGNTTTGLVWNASFLLLNDSSGIINGYTTPSGVTYGTHDPPVLKESNVSIRVSTDSQACEIYDTITGEILLSSRDR